MQSDSNPRASLSSTILVGSKIQKAITDYNLICDDDKILVGLSGGADSIMLTHYLKFCLKLPVFACHVNHNLRGEESERDMNFVERICEQWDIPLKIHSVDVTDFALQNKLTIEEAGRELRYDFFKNDSEFFGATKIATAHTLSDNAETMLFNLVRGTGLKGICGISPKRDNIIRPIINLTRADVENYIAEFEIEHITDSTNFDTIYTRNKIRHDVLPKLVSVNPQFLPAINRTIKTLSVEQDFLELQTLEAYEDCKKNDGIVINKLVCYHEAIVKRVIALFLEENKIPRNFDLINKLFLIVIKEKGKINVSGNAFIEVSHHMLQIATNEQELEPFSIPLEVGTTVLPDGQLLEISILDQKEIKEIIKVYKKLLYVITDYDKIDGKMLLRNRKSGDKIRLANRFGTKSLKKLFIDEKLSNIAKSKQVVLSNEDDDVFGVVGFGEDVSVAVDEGTVKFLVVLKCE